MTAAETIAAMRAEVQDVRAQIQSLPPSAKRAEMSDRCDALDAAITTAERWDLRRGLA